MMTRGSTHHRSMPNRLVAALLLLATAVVLDSSRASGSKLHEGLIQAHYKAREEVQAHWQYDPLMVCRPAAVHGPVRKRAIGEAIAVLIVNDAYYPHLQRVSQSGVPKHASILVYISHAHRFIYIRQNKASSTSIVTSLRARYCGDPSNCTALELRVVRADYIEKAHWALYFVFTVVRNPIMRMISTYNMFRRYLRVLIPPDQPGGEDKPGEPCGVSFADFARDTSLLRSICTTRQCCAYMSDNGKEPRFVTEFPSSHITLQSHSIFTPDGRPIVDYIGRVERLDEDWQDILTRIAQRNSESGAPPAPLARLNSHLPSMPAVPELGHPCLAPDVVALGLLNETTAFDISMAYALDMQRLGFLMNTGT